MDENVQASLKDLLRAWMNAQQQSLLEQVMLTWSNGIAQASPDDELIRSLVEALPPPPPAVVPLPPAPPVDTDADLGAGLSLLDDAATQGEVLKHLLEGLHRFADRSALFVLKQGIATLFAHRGFEEEAPRTGSPVVPPPELEDLVVGRTGIIAAPGAAYSALLAPLSPTPARDVRVLPLHLRKKTVALLLVDSGKQPSIPHANHVRALALAAEARLSYLAGAKEEEKAAPVEAHPSTLTQRIPDTIADLPANTLDPTVRINAERSARVLVGDIELYFPAKVTQGQQLGSLYPVLRDELDRSRSSFVERYGAELENQHQIFYQTVVHQLCGGDPSRLGPTPWAAL